MGKLHKNSNGYSAIEALLILVALAIVGFVGWYVHHATQKANTTYSIHETNTTPSKKTETKTKTPAASNATPAAGEATPAPTPAQ